MNRTAKAVGEAIGRSKHAMTAAAVAGGALVGACAMLLMNTHGGPGGSVLGRDAYAGGIPTIDVSSIAQIVKQIGTLARQAEQLEGLNLTMDAIEEGLGTVQQVGQFKDKVLSRIEKGDYKAAYRSVRMFGNRHGLGMDLPSGRHTRTPGGLDDAIKGLNQGNNDGINLHDGGNPQPTGTVESLDTEEEARAYATARYFVPQEVDGGAVLARDQLSRQVERQRAVDLRAQAIATWALSVEAGKAYDEVQKNEVEISEALAEAESMREEVSLLALATIEAGRTQAFANRLTAEALRTTAIRELVGSQVVISTQEYESLGGEL